MTLDFKVVVPVALMSLVSLVLAFVPHHTSGNRQIVDSTFQQDSIDEAIEFEDDAVYFDQLAEEFISMLPSDKRIIAKLIDAQNHKVIYYETTENPSCYCYDLETQNTSVLFGSHASWYTGGETPTGSSAHSDYLESQGFYIDTKLLILGKITNCQRVGDKAVFIATNQAPQTGYENAVHTFELNLNDHSMRYIATGASAYFSNDTQLVVNHAQLLYRSLFTDEDVFTTAPTVYNLL